MTLLPRHTLTPTVHVTTVFDKACRSFQRGEHRKAFMLFDICVTIRPLDAQYSLSRGICAFSLCVFAQTLKDAYAALQLKHDERDDADARHIRMEVSPSLREAMADKDARDDARAHFWLGKAYYELGDMQKALHNFTRSQKQRKSEKTDAMIEECNKLSQASNMLMMHRQAARTHMRLLFCDENRWWDEEVQSEGDGVIRHAKKVPINATLQHPTDSQLPETLTGTLGLFYRAPYEAEKERLLQCIRSGSTGSSSGVIPLSFVGAIAMDIAPSVEARRGS